MRTVSLTIESLGSQTHVRLCEDERVLAEGPVDRAVPAARLARVSELLHLAFQHDGGTAADRELLLIETRRIRDSILTADMRLALESIESACLRIEAPLDWHAVPWELLPVTYSGRVMLLGERFAVGRIISGSCDEPHVVQNRLPSNGSQVSRIVVADSRLSYARLELLAVRSRLDRLQAASPETMHGIETRFVDAADVALDVEELCELMRGCRCFHFIGHAVEKDGIRKWQTGWSVDSEPLPPDGFLGPDNVAADSDDDWPELIVAHACGSATVSVSDQAGCLVDAFLQRGTRWYVGTLAPILDAQCGPVIESFYDAIVRECCLGEALRCARTEAAAQLAERNILPHLYVLFGEPGEFLAAPQDTHVPEAMNDTVRASAASDRTPDAPPQFPATCGVPECQREIRTRHGVGSVTQLEGRDVVVCRSCSRSISAAEAERDKSERLARQNRLRSCEQRAVALMRDAVDRFDTVSDLTTGRTLSVTWQLEAQVDSSLLTHSRHQGFRRAGERIAESELSRLSYSLAEQRRHGIRLGFGLDIIVTTGPQSVDQDEADAPVSDATLHELLDSHDQRAARGESSRTEQTQRGLLMLASLTGWSSEAVSFISGGPPGSYYESGRSVVLVDARDMSAHFRATDLNLLPFVGLLDFDDEGEQVFQALDFITGRLPLTTSLPQQTVVQTLGLRPTAVIKAFRLAAVRHGLHCDAVTGSGLVLSQSGGGRRASHDTSGPEDDASWWRGWFDRLGSGWPND